MAIEDIGELINTKIPGYADDADIQAALRTYHYGTDDPSAETETDIAQIPTDSIARRLHDLREDLSALDAEVDGKIGGSTFNAKGDLLVGTANDSYQVLTSGANGKTLVVNTGTTTGLEWQDFPSSFTNLSAATLNVSGNAVFHIAIKQIPGAGNGNYTPTAGDITDDGKLLEFSNTTGTTMIFRIPNNSVNPYPVGTQISILRAGDGDVLIQAIDQITTIIDGTPGFYLRAKWSSATLIKRSTNSWVLIGDLKSSL